MTNADKYLKDGVDVEELRKEFEDWYAITRRANTPANYLVEFLNEKVKPTLTEDEKVILRQLKKNYCVIGKNKYNCFLLRETKSDYEQIGVSLDIMLTGLFQFIQPRRRI